MTVVVAPMPAEIRAIRKLWRPCAGPIFPDGEPTHDEIELAIDLLDALDAESFAWYGGAAMVERLRARRAT